LKKEGVLLAGLQIVNVKRADDLLSVNYVSRINGSSQCSRCLRIRGVNVARERSRHPDGGGYEMTAIEAVPSWIVRHRVEPFMLVARLRARQRSIA
jgi:hypothetical protein